MATRQHKSFCVREFIKTESATAVQHAFCHRQPVERAENLEYRNQLSGVCLGAVYSSIESIYLNHPVYRIRKPDQNGIWKGFPPSTEVCSCQTPIFINH